MLIGKPFIVDACISMLCHLQASAGLQQLTPPIFLAQSAIGGASEEFLGALTNKAIESERRTTGLKDRSVDEKMLDCCRACLWDDFETLFKLQLPGKRTSNTT
jgi:hypothetical protein